MRRLLVPAAIAVAILGAIGAYAIAGSNSDRPMTGQIDLSGGPTGTCDTGVNRIDLTGTGNLAHLGEVQVTATNCTAGNLDLGDGQISLGASTFTTADGSTINASYVGQQRQIVGNVSSYSTTHTVTGGTGRFAHATGTWTIAGTVDVSIGRLLGDVSGWVRY